MIKLKIILTPMVICSIILSCNKADIYDSQSIDSNLIRNVKTIAGTNYYTVSQWSNTNVNALGLKEVLAKIVHDQSVGIMTASVIQLNDNIYVGAAFEIVVPSNVTISGGGDYGYGVNGKTIYGTTPKEVFMFMVTGENVTFERLKIIGPWNSYSANSQYTRSSGILFLEGANNGKVQFSEIYGFPGAAIKFISKFNIVYGNNIHDNYMLIGNLTMGYGVFVCDGGNAVVHHNYFDNNHHAIAGGGKNAGGVESSYDAYWNNVKDSGGRMRSHHFDMHGNTNDCLAGNIMNIYDNAFYYDASHQEAIMIRGNPQSYARVYHNAFINDPNINSAVRQVKDFPGYCGHLINMYVWENVCNGYPGDPYTTVQWHPE